MRKIFQVCYCTRFKKCYFCRAQTFKFLTVKLHDRTQKYDILIEPKTVVHMINTIQLVLILCCYINVVLKDARLKQLLILVFSLLQFTQHSDGAKIKH